MSLSYTISHMKVNARRFKNHILTAIPFWTASVITGFIAVIYAKLFQIAEDQITSIYTYNPYLIFLITPVCFVSAWLLVRFLQNMPTVAVFPK